MKQHIDVPIRMRDGVCLSADVRIPEGGGPFPALVARSPYGNVDPRGYRSIVESGYTVIEQDCRGRFDSEGRFEPFHEAEDGYDTLAFTTRKIPSLPWAAATGPARRIRRPSSAGTTCWSSRGPNSGSRSK